MKSVIKILFVLLLIGCNSNQSIPDNFDAIVIGVKDGDTIEVIFKKKGHVIRLEGIDCPEKKQAFGNKAKQLTSNLCFNKTVKIVSNGKRDRYNRILATVYIDSLNINAELIKQGLAWHYKKYSDNELYSILEEKAIADRIGLWQDNDPVAPWEFRSKKKHL